MPVAAALREAPSHLQRSIVAPLWPVMVYPAIAFMLVVGLLAAVDSLLKFRALHELATLFLVACALVALTGLIAAALLGAIGAALTTLGCERTRCRLGVLALGAGLSLGAVVVTGFYGVNAWLKSLAASNTAPGGRLDFVVVAVALLVLAVPFNERIARITWRAGAHVARFFRGPALLIVVAALIGALTGLGAPVSASFETPDPVDHGGVPAKNVLLITADALTAADMSVYGYARDTTPALRAFARGASQVPRFYANATFTSSGVASLLSGQRPWTHRVLHFGIARNAARDRPSLAGVFRGHGYATAAFTANPFAHPDYQRVARDFSHLPPDYLQYPSARVQQAILSSGATSLHNLPTVFPFYQLLERADRIAFALRPRWNPQAPDRQIGDALAYMERTRREGKPFFVWIHLVPPHHYYLPPEPYLYRFEPRRVLDRASAQRFAEGAFTQQQAPTVAVLRARYDENVAYVDAEIGRLLDEARRRELFDDTVIAITADHGESFDHGYLMHGGPLLHESLIHIPLLIKDSRQREPAAIAAIGEQADLLPTLAALCGLPVPAGVDGRSLYAPDGERSAFAMSLYRNAVDAPLSRGSVALMRGEWKYIQPLGGGMRRRGQLYNLATDPGELHDLAAREPRRVGIMRAELARQVERSNAAPMPRG